METDEQITLSPTGLARVHARDRHEDAYCFRPPAILMITFFMRDGRWPGFWSGINDEKHARAPVACPASGIRTRARDRDQGRPYERTKVARI